MLRGAALQTMIRNGKSCVKIITFLNGRKRLK